ncbi:MAG: hypothetical protein QW041_02765 [Candidatus Pacearchaeota archaeon]
MEIYLPNKKEIEKLEKYSINLVKTIDNFVNPLNGIYYEKIKAPIYWDNNMITEALINLESGKEVLTSNYKSIPIVIYKKLSNIYTSIKEKLSI